ncbi:hypothetical protein NTE_03056 [Candidatus Nitrososphaera evergladensis SR1]|uniref:Uncharacterized protein n=1 Tax=Candidatus Nitrososphaera evergladensis SR1 TaxID=1459636 RepID=A0A075MTW7_9ARCH|nr:hypothetical protein [Candidatus Nitrososphaera evergladensis]AIF85091.1 hypothetical protein NTE_03056 [Candidatus Nitrososphaera evergladensis SR1]
MSLIGIDSIVQEIEDRRLYNDDEITAFLVHKGIVNREQKIQLFKAITEDFLYDHSFMQNHIMEVFSDGDDFVDLILHLSSKNYHSSVSKLADAYKHDPVQALNLYDKILKNDSKSRSIPLAQILFGIGKNDLTKFYSMLDFSDQRPEIKTAYIEALRYLSYEVSIKKSSIDYVIEQSDSVDAGIRETAIHFMLSAGIDDIDVRNRLVELASNGQQNDKIRIGWNGLILQKRNKSLCLELVKLLSESEDIAVLKSLGITMGSVAEDYPVECLEIIRRWFNTESLRNKISTGWAPERVDAYLLKWITEEKDELILKFDLPKLIWDIFEKGDKTRLLNILYKIDVSTEGGLTVFDEVAGKALSEMHKNPQHDSTFVERCHELVCRMAIARGVDPSTIKINKDDKTLLTLAILERATADKKEIDFSAVLSNVAQYKNIERLVGRKWFEERASKKDTSQPLIWLLAKANPKEEEIKQLFEELEKYKDDQLRKWSVLMAIRLKLQPYAVLEHIDRSIAIFMKDPLPRLKAVRDSLINPDQIYQTVGELVLAAHLRAAYPAEIQFKVGKKIAGCRTIIEGKEIIIEVVNPDMSLESKYLRGVLTQAGNRTKSQIKNKLKEQIPEIAKNTDAPIFLAINRGRSGIDDMEIADTLYGSLKVRMYLDKETSKVVKSESFREADGISTDNAGRQVSGVIFYNTVFDFSDFKEKLEGDIFENDTDRPVSKDMIKKMKEVLFNKALP